MEIRKLSSNSEKLLLEIVQAKNPTQALNTKYDGVSIQKRHELDSIVRELKEYGYMDVKWADNMPYIVTLNNSAHTYTEQLVEYETKKSFQTPQETKVEGTIFLSHRSTDKDIADMLVDFFSGTGIPKELVFCSSLPGNDVNEKIAAEVKKALKKSIINIAILSQEYYQSAYCLNEAGILWYEGVPVILIALPEINPGNMYGFLNNEYKLRRLDCDTDISDIYDLVRKAVSVPHMKTSVITNENNKLREKYARYLETREPPKSTLGNSIAFSPTEITTDDERIVLYYILKKKVRKVSKAVIANWLNECEIYDVNVDNAFDLLSSFGVGTANSDTLELDLDFFRQYSVNANLILLELQKCVEQHTRLAVDIFKKLWLADTLDPTLGLFLAYILDERMRSYGSRWMAEGQVESIKQWENKNLLDSTLSSNYGSCLDFFVQNHLVYESSWTSYGNAREYSLCPSLQNYLFKYPTEVVEELQRIKNAHCFELPF